MLSKTSLLPLLFVFIPLSNMQQLSSCRRSIPHKFRPFPYNQHAPFSTQLHQHKLTLKDHYGLFIDGQFQSAPNSDSFSVENPATKEILCTVTSAQPEDVALAIDCAHNAFMDGRWRKRDIRGYHCMLSFYLIFDIFSLEKNGEFSY